MAGPRLTPFSRHTSLGYQVNLLARLFDATGGLSALEAGTLLALLIKVAANLQAGAGRRSFRT